MDKERESRERLIGVVLRHMANVKAHAEEIFPRCVHVESTHLLMLHLQADLAYLLCATSEEGPRQPMA